MKKHLLIIGICIVILLIPISSAVDIITDVDDKSRENSEIETLDNYEEIITFIDGTCNDVTTKGIYIKRDVTFQAEKYRAWDLGLLSSVESF